MIRHKSLSPVVPATVFTTLSPSFVCAVGSGSSPSDRWGPGAATMAKRLINDPADFVPEMLEGLVLCHPTVTRLQDVNVIVRADYNAVKDTQVRALGCSTVQFRPAKAPREGHRSQLFRDGTLIAMGRPPLCRWR